MKEIIDFLTQLACNNNREWFQANHDTYTRCRQRFEDFTADYLQRLCRIDDTLVGLQPKDCIWRIYRNVRFSNDKRPYKEHFGTFPAAKGGKKSDRAGYYVHIQPGHSLFAAGMWCPNTELLHVLRQEIYANYDELEEIFNQPLCKRYFRDFDTEYMLKKVPNGFPADSPHADWLKRKAFTISTPLSDEEVCAPDFLDHVTEIATAAKPINDFLNYTFEQYGEFPDKR